MYGTVKCYILVILFIIAVLVKILMFVLLILNYSAQHTTHGPYTGASTEFFEGRVWSLEKFEVGYPIKFSSVLIDLQTT